MRGKKVIKFEKVSYEQFKEDVLKALSDWDNFDSSEEHIKDIYDNIKLPKRATDGSAGYDFFTPFELHISSSSECYQTLKFPTGIRVEMPKNVVLLLFPRSSLGFKYRLQLDNTIGVIDSDYYYSDNEGHMWCKFTKGVEHKELYLNEGDAYMQGIFINYLLTDDDSEDDKQVRNGGFGSTDQKEV
jgi:dUTP pyrophosphatase